MITACSGVSSSNSIGPIGGPGLSRTEQWMTTDLAPASFLAESEYSPESDLTAFLINKIDEEASSWISILGLPSSPPTRASPAALAQSISGVGTPRTIAGMVMVDPARTVKPSRILTLISIFGGTSFCAGVTGMVVSGLPSPASLAARTRNLCGTPSFKPVTVHLNVPTVANVSQADCLTCLSP